MLKLIFENVTSAIINSKNFIYTADARNNILKLKFPISDIIYDCYGEHVEGERVVKYNDIVDVEINGVTFSTIWHEEDGEDNRYQKSKLKDDIVTIKWKGCGVK